DDLPEYRVDVLCLVEEDRVVGQSWPSQRPDLEVVVVIENESTVRVGDVLPRLLGVRHHGGAERDQLGVHVLWEVPGRDRVVGAFPEAADGGDHEAGERFRLYDLAT